MNAIARHYGADDGRYPHALLLDRAVAVAIDGWAEGNAVHITLIPDHDGPTGLLTAIVAERGGSTTMFQVDLDSADPDNVQEVWLTSGETKRLAHVMTRPVQVNEEGGAA